MDAWGVTQPPINKHSHVPREDFYEISKNVFCVADGITRDPLIPEDWTEVKQAEALEHYPNPSPAAAAAQLAVESFIISASASSTETALMAANQSIAELNRGQVCDYLRHDFAACVAVGGKIEDSQLHWASVGDCQVAIFSREGSRLFLSPNGLENFSAAVRENPGNWRDPARRVEIRRRFRNNPENPAGYGALTGEKTAEHFMMSGQEPLPDGVVVLFFSDGFAPTLERPDFWKVFQQGRKEFLRWELELAQANPEKYGHERTMIVVRLKDEEPTAK